MNWVCSLALFKESAEYSLVWSVGKLDIELTGNDLDAIPASRRFYHAPDRERAFFLQELGHRDIGGDHEAFDDIFGDIMFAHGEVLDFTLFNDRRSFG